MGRGWIYAGAIVIAIALFILLFYPYTKVSRRRVVRMGSESEEDPVDLILQTLRDEGDELALARETTFCLLFVDEGAASTAAQEISKMGYRVDVSAPEPEYEERFWTCDCIATIVPGADETQRRVVQLEAVATRHGGQVDGWDNLFVRL